MDRNFFLIGGANDPLSFRYEVAIRDADGIEHKSAERYYWYKMAELFKDTVSILHFNTRIFTLNWVCILFIAFLPMYLIAPPCTYMYTHLL